MNRLKWVTWFGFLSFILEKGYKQQWSYELHKFEKNNHDGTYIVNGEWYPRYPRKELQVVTGEIKSYRQIQIKKL